MNFLPFFNRFELTMDSGNGALVVRSRSVDAEFSDVIDELGGKTFNDGLYRVLRGDQVQCAKEAMERAFPEFADRIVPFGYDWLGRHFAVDFARIERGNPQVLMLEIGTGEAMQIPATIRDFHNVELVEHSDDALAVLFFHRWRRENSAPLMPNECVGYKVPLFLAGKDDILNLEIIDLSVYVEICGQLRNKTRMLRPGQTIRRISITD